MNDKVVIFGAGGFLGRAMLDFLLHKGFENIVAIRSPRSIGSGHADARVQTVCVDLTLGAPPKPILDGVKWVYNFAASVGGVGYMLGPNKTACLSSVAINLNILNALKDNPSCAGYLFTSSACVYPDDGLNHPFKEADARTHEGSYAYAKEKLYSEDMCRAFNQEHGVPVHIARLDGLFGSGDGHHGVGRDHAPVALAKKVVQAKISGEHEISIWGNGEQTRSFLYIDDAVEGIYRLMNAPGVSAPMNISNGKGYTINDLVGNLEIAAGVKLTRFYSSTAPSGLQTRVTNNTFMRETLKWTPQVDFATGTRRLFNDQWDQALKKAT